MLKKLLSVLICLTLIFSLCSCGSEETESSKTDTKTNYTAKFKDGTPAAPGDVYNPPAGGNDSSITLGQASAQAYPDDSVIVMGEGFSGNNVQAYVYAQSTKGDGKAHKASFLVTEDQTAMVTINKDLDYGLYGIFFEADGKKSNVLYVNRPKIWWVGVTQLTAGEKLKIFGENLSTDNKNNSYVYLVADGKYCELKVTFADPYKVEALIPEGLENGKEYEILLHNGHGGELGFAKAEEKFIFSKDPTIVFGGETFDVTEFGAKGNDDLDDSAAIQQAVDNSADGDTIFFPAGRYIVDNPLVIEKAIKLMGFSQKGQVKSTLVVGSEMKGSLIDACVGPFEVTSLNLWDVRQTKLENTLISFVGDSMLTPTPNVYIHGCNFTQQSNPLWNKIQPAIHIEDATQVIIEDNRLEVSQLAFINKVDKAYINNNEYISTYVVTPPAINANALLIWSTDKMESAGNRFYSRNNPTDTVTAISENNSCTNGRSYALQNYTNNLYIANNDIVGAGMPDANIGEQIMFENGRAYYLGGAQSVSADTIALTGGADVVPSAGDLVTFSDGKGKGQIRFVKTLKKNEIVLNEPLNISPDSTTVISLVHHGGYNAAIHKNKMIGYSNYYNDWGATCGVQIYSNNANLFITQNDFSYMCYGVCVSPHGGAGLSGKSVINGTYWIIIQDNKISETDTGIRFNNPTSVTQTWETAFGVAIRRNTFSDMFAFSGAREGYPGGDAISIGQALSKPQFEGDWINSTLIENNNFKASYTSDIYVYPYQDKTVLRNNTSDKEGGVKISYNEGAKELLNFK